MTTFGCKIGIHVYKTIEKKKKYLPVGRAGWSKELHYLRKCIHCGAENYQRTGYDSFGG